MPQAHEDDSLIAIAYAVQLDARADLDDLSQAQAEEVIEVVIRSRTKEVVVPVDRETGREISVLAMITVSQRYRRLWLRYLEAMENEGSAAAAQLKDENV